MSEEKTIERLKKLNKPAIVCQHLLENPDLNLNFPCDINDDQAWCDSCEWVFKEKNGWKERALEFADFKTCCRHCFIKMKEEYVEKCLRRLL